MRSWKRQPALLLWLLLALLALLPVLAYWQYRWLGEVSMAERERMQRNLQHGAAQFGQEFDQEVTFAYVTLQDGLGESFVPLTAPGTAAERFAARYSQWAAAAAHPRLIRAIYQVEAGAQGEAQLWRFDPATGAFAAADWTPELQAARQRLLQQRAMQEQVQQLLHNLMPPTEAGNKSTEVQMLGQLSRTLTRETEKATEDKKPANVAGRRATFIQMNSSGPLDEGLPGLMIPLGLASHMPFGGVPPRAYRLVQFDLSYIKQELFPELARKHLFTNGAQDYLYSVVRADKQAPRLVYQSAQAAQADESKQVGRKQIETPAEPVTGDASAPFFRVRLDARDKIILSAGGAPAEVDLPQRPGYAVSIYANEIRANGAPLEATKLAEHMPMMRKDSEGCWQLVIRHRAGSLEAAVGVVRRRNLAISFGVLALLGVSVGLIVLSSRRAQALAEKQIEFVAGVSHELRTPLSVICSAAENLADGVPGLVDNRDQIKRYGALIRDEGRRLTGMVEQVLEFAGAQSGRQTYELRPVEPWRVIEDALAALHLPIQESGFEVEAQIADELPLISADSAALSRALQNLISNALKYGGERRWLGLSARVVKHLTGEELQLAVADRGLGIAPAELPHIFDPFYRGKEVTAAQIHGNGLGLSLVKHIVKAHGGRVTVESKVGEGSTFTLHLPVVREATSSTAVIASEYEQAPSTH